MVADLAVRKVGQLAATTAAQTVAWTDEPRVVYWAECSVARMGVRKAGRMGRCSVDCWAVSWVALRAALKVGRWV